MYPTATATATATATPTATAVKTDTGVQVGSIKKPAVPQSLTQSSAPADTAITDRKAENQEVMGTEHYFYGYCYPLPEIKFISEHADLCYNKLLKDVRDYARRCQKGSDYSVDNPQAVKDIEYLIEWNCFKFVGAFFPEIRELGPDWHLSNVFKTCFSDFDSWVGETACDVIGQTSTQPHDDTSDKPDCKDKPILSLERGLARLGLEALSRRKLESIF